MTALVIVAKETIPGKVKTRLHPPLSLDQAAELAAAAIADTLAAVARLPPGIHRVLLFDGNSPPAGSEDFDVMDQVEGGLDERLGAMYDAMDEPTLMIGMDTPQVTARTLAPVFDSWAASDPEIDAWFGPASDGGFWALGMTRPDGALLRGVPMSRDDTGAVQLARLRGAGLRVGMLPELTDVDTIATALEVAELAPATRFAATLRTFGDGSGHPGVDR